MVALGATLIERLDRRCDRKLRTQAMHQLINLYQPAFRRQPKLLSAVTLLCVIATALVLLFSVAVYANSTTQDLQRTSKELALHYSQLNALVAESESTELVSSDTSIDAETALLELEIDERNALLKRIDDLLHGEFNGFGDVFEILARTNLNGLWLTGVELDYDGNIAISGTAIDPKLVPRYLELITQHGPLKRLSSGTVNLSRNQFNHAEINFELSYNLQAGGQ